MKLPNGYGAVYKLSGNRRKPWAVSKSLGYDENGKRLRKIIGYAETKEEGLRLLSEYNKNPWDLDKDKMTFSQVYELWEKHNHLGKRTAETYAGKYRTYCKPLYDIPYSDLRTYHFNEIIDSCTKSNATKNNIRKLFRSMDKIAMEYDIIQKEYSVGIPLYEVEESHRKVFTDEEIETLWENRNVQDVDLVLMFLYTGFRRSELADIKIANIDTENWFVKGGGKTQAGKNRLVPIHKRLRPVVLDLMEKAKGENLFNIGGKAIAEHFKNCMKYFHMDHIPHECRHTLRTRLDNAGANKKCIDLIMGHASREVGERVYTHKTEQQLHEAINLIK